MRVTVVGAGIVGCAVAYELATRGVQVRVVDRRGSGRGATSASAGILAPHIEGHSASLLRLGVCSLDEYDTFLQRVGGDAGGDVGGETVRPIEFRRTGTLQVARDEDEARQLEQLAGTLRARGVPHSLLDARDTRGLEPGLRDGIRAGLVVPQHGYVRAAALIAALVDAGTARGVTMSIGEIRAIAPAHGSIAVTTADETITADAVVIAAGSWSADITMTPAVPPPVRPVRGQLVQLRLAQPPISHIVWGSSAYLVPWQDGRVLVGATVEDVGFDERVTVAGVRHLLESGAELVPGLNSAMFEEARAGLRPGTSDELPIIGPSSTMRGVYYATGHYRNGVLLAPLTAIMAADFLVGGRERPEAQLVRPDRFGL